MEIALCYPTVNPARGGCETYIVDLARRLVRDGHGVHLYAQTWAADSLPAATHYHRVDVLSGPRCLRPWRFAAACEKLLQQASHDVSIGFDKTWGQDVLYPQGGLHAATQHNNKLKYATRLGRVGAAIGKWLDPAYWSFAALEKKQYFGEHRPSVIVNSRMVQGHFERFYGVPAESLNIVHSAIDPGRFVADDRPRRRHAERSAWGVDAETPTGLFIAMNYRLKGLAPLLQAVKALPAEVPFKLVVVGHRKDGEYKALAKDLGIAHRVQFCGFRSDPKDAYFGADFLIHPTFYDPCSLVVLEALACGLPVITTQYNGAAELFPAEAGTVIQDPHDAAELAAAIATACDAGYRARAKVAARNAAAAWTFDDHYRKLLAVLQNVAAARRSRRAAA
jgi:UDP-glucose:(heptosyl)LPS alpha-1,3-glucosyltransferase